MNKVNKTNFTKVLFIEIKQKKRQINVHFLSVCLSVCDNMPMMNQYGWTYPNHVSCIFVDCMLLQQEHELLLAAAKLERLLLHTYRIELPARVDVMSLGSAYSASNGILQMLHPALLSGHNLLRMGSDGNCLYRAVSCLVWARGAPSTTTSPCCLGDCRTPTGI